ncbi:MAG: hypothetical protein WA715_17050 [Candidatus Acidiferrum sp.]
MNLDATIAGNRVDSAQRWLAANNDKLDDPHIASTLVNQFGVTTAIATHLVSMEKLASHKR